MIRLLIIDDCDHTISTVKDSLSNMNIHITVSSSVESAYNVIKGLKPDIIIVETELEGVYRGYEIFDLLYDVGIRVPIIIVATDDSDIKNIYSTTIEIDEYLIKPINNMKFKEIILDILSKKGYAISVFKKNEHNKTIKDLRILNIDDEKSHRHLKTKIFDDICVDGIVVNARHGKQALEILKYYPYFDCVFVDWEMPVMNGIDFIKTVRKDPVLKDLTCIMMTSYATEKDKIRYALDIGANSYIIYPYTKDSIIKKLEDVVL